jgi:hypothetical protein
MSCLGPWALGFDSCVRDLHRLKPKMRALGAETHVVNLSKPAYAGRRAEVKQDWGDLLRDGPRTPSRLSTVWGGRPPHPFQFEGGRTEIV